MNSLCRMVVTAACAAALVSPALSIEPMKVRERPKTLFGQPADVVIVWQEVLDDCAENALCVQGELQNTGGKPARDVKLQIDIGATRVGRPRLSVTRPVDITTMDPGDRQDFFFQIGRRMAYQSKGKEKFLEVGKFNFRIVPKWADAAKAPKRK